MLILSQIVNYYALQVTQNYKGKGEISQHLIFHCYFAYELPLISNDWCMKNETKTKEHGIKKKAQFLTKNKMIFFLQNLVWVMYLYLLDIFLCRVQCRRSVFEMGAFLWCFVDFSGWGVVRGSPCRYLLCNPGWVFGNFRMHYWASPFSPIRIMIRVIGCKPIAVGSSSFSK